MFVLLTKYLLQYKRVVIPHVGGLELYSRPAALNFADKLIMPPGFTSRFVHKYEADMHQVNYIAQALQTDAFTVLDQLNEFGESLKYNLQLKPLVWNGIGELAIVNGSVTFQPQEVVIEALEPVAAHKVLRENVQHTVLRGEQEVQVEEVRSIPVTEESVEPEMETVTTSKKTFLIIGWILAALAIGFIIFYFYTNGFNISSAGYQQKIKPATVKPTYN